MAAGQILTLPASSVTGVTAASAASAWGYGAWVSLGDPLDRSISIGSVDFRPTIEPALDTTHEILMEIGTGIAGLQVVKAQIPYSIRKDTAIGYYQDNVETITFPELMLMADGDRLWVRFADSNTSAQNYEGVRIRYTDNLVAKAKASTFMDNFNDNTINETYWDRGYAAVPANILEQNGRLEMAHGNVQYQSLITKAGYDMVDSSVFVKITDAGNQAYFSHSAQINVVLNETNKIWFEVSGNTLGAWRTVAGTQTQVGSLVGYNKSRHKYLRIRNDGGQVYFDYSSDATNWFNVFGPFAAPWDMTNLKLGLVSGNWQTEAGGTYAYFDNFNITPETIGAPPFTENWSSGIGAGWNNWGGSPYVTVEGGDLKLTNLPASTNYYGLTYNTAFDWAGKYCSVHLKALPALNFATDPEYSTTPMNLEIDSNNRYMWSWEGNNELAAIKVVGGSYQWQAAITSFNPLVHKYIRIRFNAAGTEVYWEWSTDYDEWVQLATMATTGVSTAALYYSAANGNWATVAGTYNATLGDVNLSAETSKTNFFWFMLPPF